MKKSTVKKSPSKAATTGKTVKAPEVKKPVKAYDEEMTDAFIQEVNEEVKNDNLKVFWDKYGLFIILFVVVAVSAAVSFETIKSWKDQKYQAQTENYLISLQTAANYEVQLKALEKIAASDNGIYSQLARIQIATILFEQNKTEEGKQMLQSIVDNDELNSKIRNLAAVKLATYEVDTASYAQIQALLQPIIDEQSSWSPLATDLLAMSAIQNGDIDTARSLYEGLLENANISENFKSRIQDMLSTLNSL